MEYKNYPGDIRYDSDARIITQKEVAIDARMMKTPINRFVEKAVRDELALINRS